MAGKNEWYRRYPIGPIFFLVGTMWIVFALQQIFPMTVLGIVPRTTEGLRGILFSPFLHGHFSHIMANTAGVVPVGFLFFTLIEEKRFWKLTVPLYLLSGLLTWVLGRGGAVHIGMSGFLYAMMGYLFFVGVFQRNFKNVLFSAVAITLYGGAWVGLLPNNQGVSWEAHLGGALAGLLLARKRF